MNDRLVAPAPVFSIAATERDTGLSKDTLRVWERRYGFPAPLRDPHGERLYPFDQVERLRMLKRLIDIGHRPGRIVALPVDALQQLSAQADHGRKGPGAAAPVPDLRPYLDLLRSHDVESLRRLLGQAKARMGLARFVTDVAAPLNTLIGEAWMRGQLEIFEEHVYTESMQVVLRQAIEAIPVASLGDRPRVLLTTFPGEPHGLGLLMAEALLALEGARCLSLGVATPIWDIVLAAAAHRSDLVALSFTGCMNPNQVIDGLVELRSKLPAPVALWAGGAAPALHRRPVEGVAAIASLSGISDALERWRQRVA